MMIRKIALLLHLPLCVDFVWRRALCLRHFVFPRLGWLQENDTRMPTRVQVSPKIWKIDSFQKFGAQIFAIAIDAPTWIAKQASMVPTHEVL
jgi:hypothetical protein